MTLDARSNPAGPDMSQHSLVLVIEDDPGLNMMMRHMLSRRGFEVIAAHSGAEGVRQVLAHAPTLMLLDYALPDMLCTSLVETLTQKGHCPPFIVVTGQGDERVAVTTMKLGARDYLIKDEHLLNRLPRVVKRACDELASEKRLVAARREIELLNTELEARVQSRTAELAAAHKRARLMMKVAEGANQASNAEQAVQIALQAACQQTEMVLGHAWWRSDDTETLISSGQWYTTRTEDPITLYKTRSENTWHPGEGIPGQVLSNRLPIWIADLQETPGILQASVFRSVGLRSGVFVPVLVDGAVHALIELFDTKVRPFDSDLQSFLTRIAAQLGSVIRRRRGERALRRAKDMADQANRAKSQFLTSMSHEIRTPMNAILGFAQLLQRDSELTPTGSEHIQRILRAGSHLLSLIDEVLEMSKIEARRITIAPIPMDLNAFVQDLEAMFQNRADKRGLSLVTVQADDLPRFVLGDTQKLLQILINLLSNALKFTDEGEITIRVSRGTGDLIRFDIEDTGLGIPQEQQQRVFERFEQLHNQRGGAGLGLAISSSLAELMDGQIEMKSQLDKGSRFTLTLPLPKTSTPIPEGEIQSIPPIVRAGLKALVVDDAEDNRALLAGQLRKVGFDVQTACSGPEALVKFAAARPSVVLLDLLMPGMNGIEVIPKLRAMPDGAKIPIVVISACVIDGVSDAVLEAGADRFLRKPLLLGPMMQVLSELLHFPSEAMPAEEVQHDRITLTPDRLAVLRPEQLSALLRATQLGDVQLLEDLLSEFPLEASTKDTLTKLVDNFRYDELQALFTP